MDAKYIALWMQSESDKQGCIYQDDAVDHAIKVGGETLLRENADGNLVLGRASLQSLENSTKTMSFGLNRRSIGVIAFLRMNQEEMQEVSDKPNNPVRWTVKKLRFLPSADLPRYMLKVAS